MNRFTALFSFVALFFWASYSMAQNATYQITINETDQKILQVEATFILEDSLLYMSPNGPMPDRWPQYINRLELHDKNGAPLSVSKEKTYWITQAKIGQPVTLSYQVSLTHSNQEWPGGIDGVAFTNNWGYFFTGRAIFVMNGDRRTNINVRFDTPKNWKVSVPWKDHASEKSNFDVKNHQDLTESLIMAGQHKRLIVSQDNLKLQFVLGGNGIIQQQEQIKNLAQETMSYYIDLMGGVPLTGSKDNNTIMVVINQADQVDGEVIGSHISMLLDPQSPPTAADGGLVHVCARVFPPLEREIHHGKRNQRRLV